MRTLTDLRLFVVICGVYTDLRSAVASLKSLEPDLRWIAVFRQTLCEGMLASVNSVTLSKPGVWFIKVFYVWGGRRGHLTWFHKIRFMLCYVMLTTYKKANIIRKWKHYTVSCSKLDLDLRRKISNVCIKKTNYNRHGPKRGGCCAPFAGARTPSSTMRPGPRSTSVPSGVFVHPAIWPQ